MWGEGSGGGEGRGEEADLGCDRRSNALGALAANRAASNNQCGVTGETAVCGH